jgi:hypothetical protein
MQKVCILINIKFQVILELQPLGCEDPMHIMRLLFLDFYTFKLIQGPVYSCFRFFQSPAYGKRGDSVVRCKIYGTHAVFFIRWAMCKRDRIHGYISSIFLLYTRFFPPLYKIKHWKIEEKRDPIRDPY